MEKSRYILLQYGVMSATFLLPKKLRKQSNGLIYRHILIIAM